MLMLALMSVGTTSALDLMPGNYFFDNSKLHFSQVKMIVGNVTLANKFTRVYDMTQITDHDWWQATINAKVNNATYFVFAETDVASTCDAQASNQKSASTGANRHNGYTTLSTTNL